MNKDYYDKFKVEVSKIEWFSGLAFKVSAGFFLLGILGYFTQNYELFYGMIKETIADDGVVDLGFRIVIGLGGFLFLGLLIGQLASSLTYLVLRNLRVVVVVGTSFAISFWLIDNTGPAINALVKLMFG